MQKDKTPGNKGLTKEFYKTPNQQETPIMASIYRVFQLRHITKKAVNQLIRKKRPL